MPMRLGESGWLARATVSFDDGKGTATTTADFVYNTAVTIEEPAGDNAFEVASEEAAQVITGS